VTAPPTDTPTPTPTATPTPTGTIDDELPPALDNGADGRNPFNDPIDFAELWRRIAVEPVNPPSSDPYFDAVTQPVGPTWWEEKSVMGFLCLETPPGGTWINFPLWAPMAVLGGVGAAAWALAGNIAMAAERLGGRSRLRLSGDCHAAGVAALCRSRETRHRIVETALRFTRARSETGTLDSPP